MAVKSEVDILVDKSSGIKIKIKAKFNIGDIDLESIDSG